jgi:hypothetical protein
MCTMREFGVKLSVKVCIWCVATVLFVDQAHGQPANRPQLILGKTAPNWVSLVARPETISQSPRYPSFKDAAESSKAMALLAHDSLIIIQGTNVRRVHVDGGSLNLQLTTDSIRV